MAGSLPYSKFLISVSQGILLLSWLLDGDLKNKFSKFFKNKIALSLTAVFLMHLIGLLYTSDCVYGLGDIKKKTPLLLLPLLFSTSAPLSKKMSEMLLSAFTISVIIGTLIGFYILSGFIDREILHPKQSSIFISHIRFGLMIALAVFVLFYFISTEIPVYLKVIASLLILWLMSFLIMMESASGLVCIVAGALLLAIRKIIFTNNYIVRITISTFIIFSLGIVFYSIKNAITNSEVSKTSTNLPLGIQTKNGNLYYNDTINKDIENGNYTWRNVCESELEKSWNERSNINYASKDKRGNEIKYTLIRFLTSKGLNKDSEGVLALNLKEQEAIENGIANVNYMGLFNPTARIQEVVWEWETYQNGHNPSGHSVTQRFEFWKAAVGIIKENLLFGVGTGDVKNAFASQYEKMNSPLSMEWRLRSHNQYLAIATAFGIVGLFIFFFSLFYPLCVDGNFKSYFYVLFFIIAALSMLVEDTLESQIGITFFAFFNSFFLFLYKKPTTNNN